MTVDRRRRADEADDLLRLLLANTCDALGTGAEGIALVGGGGYGRRELSPDRDLDAMVGHGETCEGTGREPTAIPVPGATTAFAPAARRGRRRTATSGWLSDCSTPGTSRATRP